MNTKKNKFSKDEFKSYCTNFLQNKNSRFILEKINLSDNPFNIEKDLQNKTNAKKGKNVNIHINLKNRKSIITNNLKSKEIFHLKIECNTKKKDKNKKLNPLVKKMNVNMPPAFQSENNKETNLKKYYNSFKNLNSYLNKEVDIKAANTIDSINQKQK